MGGTNQDGGQRIVDTLGRHGVRQLFTLVGGHISPILVSAKRSGIRVIDVRDEATTVFAADAVARLTGRIGVAAVTAGPGVTNTLTALKNAQQAQSPVLLLGGATATILKGRGSLQDIDQLAVVRPHVKLATSVGRRADLQPILEHAIAVARSGIPGPVFVECPVDLLYPQEVVRGWYGKDLGNSGGSLAQKGLRWYVGRHLDRLFREKKGARTARTEPVAPPAPAPWVVRRAAGMLARAKRPVLVLGSQVVTEPDRISALADSLEGLGAPVFLAGMSRGLLGRDHSLQVRSGRKAALEAADLVLVAGLPFDFRLNYGQHINRRAKLIAVNHNPGELYKNRAPDLAVHTRPGRFLQELAGWATHDPAEWQDWLGGLVGKDRTRAASCLEDCDKVDPLELCRQIDSRLDDDSVLVVDGGDFVGTASYFVRPRRPLSWLDPGVFGTLGVGAGFAMGAKLVRPEAEIWLLYGDGSLGYSLSEFDTFCRHGFPVIAVVGNDASWAQIARDQVSILGDDVATVLSPTDYHRAAEGLGARGFLLEKTEDVPRVLEAAKRQAAAGRPVLVNALIQATDFRHGSLSI